MSPQRINRLESWPTQVISVCMHKGGSGKTAVSCHLGHAYVMRLSEMLEGLGLAPEDQGIRVCLVDLDPQGDLSAWLGKSDIEESWFDDLPELHQSIKLEYTAPWPVRPTIADLVRAKVDGGYDEALLQRSIEAVAGIDGLYLIRNDQRAQGLHDLLIALHAEAEPEREGRPAAVKYQGATRFIREVLEDLVGRFDAVIFDCPPAVSRYVDAALQVSDRVVIPMLADVRNLRQSLETRDSVRLARRVNPKLDLGVVLVNADDERTHMSKDVIRPRLQHLYGKLLYEKSLRTTVLMRELDVPTAEYGRGMTMFEHDPMNAVCRHFLAIADRLIAQHPRLTHALRSASSSRWAPASTLPAGSVG